MCILVSDKSMNGVLLRRRIFIGHGQSKVTVTHLYSLVVGPVSSVYSSHRHTDTLTRCLSVVWWTRPPHFHQSCPPLSAAPTTSPAAITVPIPWFHFNIFLIYRIICFFLGKTRRCFAEIGYGPFSVYV